jgi:phage protein D
VDLPDFGQSLFTGQITAIESVYEPSDPPKVRIRAYDALHHLRKRQPVRAFVDVTIADIADEMVRDLGLSVTAEASGPRWPQLLQYRQSDLDFLASLASRCGQYLVLRGRELHLASLGGLGGPTELVLGESLLEACVEFSAEPACRGVKTTAWDPGLVEMRSGSAVEARVGKVNEETAPWVVGEDGRRTIAHETARTDEEAQALAQAHLDLRSHRELVLRGVAEGNPELRTGAGVILRGVAEREVGPHVLAKVIHTIDTSRGYLTEFSSETPPPPSPVAGATLAFGLVTNVDDPDEHGRVKVSLPSCGDLETDWMQVLLPAAGPNKGVMAMPDIDDRVLVLLAGNEASHGVVLGGVYGPGTIPDSGVEGGRTRRFTFRTPGGQRVCLDDQQRLVRLENSDGTYLEFSPDAVELHASRDVRIDAPGRSIEIRGATIDFRKA